MPLVTIAVTILPCLLIFLYIYTHDEHPEPKGLIAKVALFGALSAIPVLLVVGPIQMLGTPPGALERSLYIAFVFAAIPEEFFKMLMVHQVAYKRPEFDEPMDGVIYGTASSLGFAMLENIFYVGQFGLQTGIIRAFTAIPMHLFCGATMGYFMGRAKFVKEGESNARFWAAALLIPIVFHGLYDASIFYADAIRDYYMLIPGVAALVGVIVTGVLLMKRLEHRNFQILSAYYGIPEAEFHKHLPKGSQTESKLPQMLAFFKEAAATGGIWAVPPDFKQRFEQQFGAPVAAVNQSAGRRGFLGFLFFLFGILLVGLGALLILSGTLGALNKLDKPMSANASYTLMGLGLFTVINGILLYLKGFFRNRKQVQRRTIFAQLGVFTTFFIASFATLAAIAYFDKPEEGDPLPPLITAAVCVFLWLLALALPRKEN